MTAPDRIWLNMGSSHVVVVNGKKSTSRLAFEEEPNGEGLPEYLRKGAFPVEEIREYLKLPYANGWNSEVPEDLLRRILSLLESDE